MKMGSNGENYSVFYHFSVCYICCFFNYVLFFISRLSHTVTLANHKKEQHCRWHRQEMKSLAWKWMRTRRSWAEPGLLLTCLSRGETRKEGQDSRKWWRSRGGVELFKRPWDDQLKGRRGDTGTVLTPSKQSRESIDLRALSDVAAMNTKSTSE